MVSRTWVHGTMVIALLAIVACSGDAALQADAGPDLSISVGDSPTFDGCASDGDIENYRWVILEAPSLMADDSGKVIRDTDPGCSFTLEAAMVAQEVGDWRVEMTVTGSGGESSSDELIVEVLP